MIAGKPKWLQPEFARPVLALRMNVGWLVAVEAREEKPIRPGNTPDSAVSDEDDLERLVLARTPRFMAILDAAERRIKKGKGIKHDDFWRTAKKK